MYGTQWELFNAGRVLRRALSDTQSTRVPPSVPGAEQKISVQKAKQIQMIAVANTAKRSRNSFRGQPRKH